VVLSGENITLNYLSETHSEFKMTGFAEKSFWAKSSIPDPKLALQVEGVATVHISTPCGITWEYPLTKVI
jgi:hypothetical protein